MLIQKLISLLIYPLGFSLVFGAFGLTILFYGSRRFGLPVIAVALLWLIIWSLAPVADALTRSLESRSTHYEVKHAPTADVILVFGGVMSPPTQMHPYADLNASADRVWHAARLYHANKAARIILSGGRNDWEEVESSQAHTMAQFLDDLGVPRSAIVLEERSRSTRENALFCAELMREQGIERALLVTSALHMPRSLAALKATGVDAIPAATDFKLRHSIAISNALNWMPSSTALHRSTLALHEWIGIAVYSWRGWL
mgnify:CR=1 FL=1